MPWLCGESTWEPVSLYICNIYLVDHWVGHSVSRCNKLFLHWVFACGATGGLTCPADFAKADKTQCEAFVTAGERCSGAASSILREGCASGNSTSWCNSRPHGCFQDMNGGVWYNEIPSDPGTAYRYASPICYKINVESTTGLRKYLILSKLLSLSLGTEDMHLNTSKHPPNFSPIHFFLEWLLNHSWRWIYFSKFVEGGGVWIYRFSKVGCLNAYPR